MRLITFLLIALFSGVAFAANPQKKNKDLTVIANPTDKEVCIIQLNGKNYLATVSDLQNITHENMESIGVNPPGDTTLTYLKKKYPALTKNVDAIMVIKLKKGAESPDKFFAKRPAAKKK